MKTVLVIVVFSVFLYSSVQAANCNTNPCMLGGYFNDTRGYRCFDLPDNTALCTCPGGSVYEIDGPCRLCNRPNPPINPCGSSPNLIACTENNDCGTSYHCLCMDTAGGPPISTLAANCNTKVPLVCGTTTGPTGPSPCLNGGVFVNGLCNCPSGYAGLICQDKEDYNLCERIRCKNRGVCAIQNPSGPYEGVCLCRYGTSGEYCELNGTLGFCSMNLCMNGGACRENVIGVTRHAYCQCEPGYNGTKCENRYYNCTAVGKFADTDMQDQGKYFECTGPSGAYRIHRRSCPKGLRFDQTSKLCSY